MPSLNSLPPRDEYSQRMQSREKWVATYRRYDDRISLARGMTFIAAIAVIAIVYDSPATLYVVVPTSLVAFLMLVVIHGRVIDRLKRSTAAVDYYRAGINRIDEKWHGSGVSGERYSDSTHVYADDLDLFGRGSLFQLISRSRTRLGEDALADWLKVPADVDTVRKRQQAVDELRPTLNLRERLALLDADVHDELDQTRLRSWARELPQPVSGWKRLAAAIISTATIVAAICWLMGYIRPTLLMVALVIHVLFLWSFRNQIRHLVRTTGAADFGLGILVQVLEQIERESFSSPMLQQIHVRLQTDGLAPSRRIAHLHRLIMALNNSVQNQFYAPMAFALCLPVHIVHGIESWRAKIGTHIPEWLDAVGQFEALSSFAGYAYERPNDPFPELIETGALFESEQLGHPLLPVTQCVRNDVSLNFSMRLIIISGSNMSGKSTLMRSVGTNAVLALAGAPVRAAKLRISPLQVGSAMRILDSLQDGKSFFYAAVSRLKQIVSLTDGTLPLLFLFDEILQGTNSHDRRVGAEGIIRKLMTTQAIGFVTTHDLALTRIADSYQPHAVNMHFEDHLVDGKMTFDYRIRPGVVERSNALELMRMMGLEV